MTWLRRLGWSVLVAATLAAAAAVYLVHLPEPQASIVIDHATLVAGPEAGKATKLPHTLFPHLGRFPSELRYRTRFELRTVPPDRLFLLIPSLNRRTSLLLNGHRLFDSETRSLWSGPMVGSSVFVQLPRALLVSGRNELTVVIDLGPFVMPFYMSKIYLGSEAALAPRFKLMVLLEQRSKTMALLAHIFLGLGIIFAYACRPKDRLFSWLAGLVICSFSLSTVFFAGFQPDLQDVLPYAAALAPAMGVLALGVACTLLDVQPAEWVKAAVVATPAVAMLLTCFGGAAIRPGLAQAEAAALIAGFVAATIVIACGALRANNIDARLTLAPFFLITWFLIRDAVVVLFLPDRPIILVTPYGRPLLLMGVILVLMRRFAMTLGELDRANETLNLKLAAREAELAALHREERLEAARLVREQERQRLTSDLHDGISGHLVSIIAMSERCNGDVKPIEQAAREALDDLRLVIYSLDLGDRELPLALANFRERLVPRLQRIGVHLAWSTANLPEVSGVTPGNALSILRVLQEAITNAVKHGPARQIAVRGTPAGDGRFAIAVENDGRPFVPGNAGLGLENMRRRARQLGGDVQICSLDGGVRLTLRLPCQLPDVLDLNPPECRLAKPLP